MEKEFTAVTITMMVVVLSTFFGGFLYFISKALRNK